MQKPIILLAATGVLALGVAACGGSSARSTAAAATSSASAAPSTSSSGGAVASKLSISASKSGALMFSTKTLKAKAGTVTVAFTNQSSEGHNFTVAQGGGGTVVGATPTFSGGTRTLTLHLKAGRYTYYCSVPGHRQAGMQGTLTVS